MKLANNEIEKYLYSTIGASFTAGGLTWNYYTNPPKGVNDDSYVWSGIELIIEDGTKDDFIGEYLLELTLVNRAPSNFTDNNAIDLAASHISELLVARGRQVSITGFNLISFNLTGGETSLEQQGQTTVLVRKLIFSILAEQI